MNRSGLGARLEIGWAENALQGRHLSPLLNIEANRSGLGGSLLKSRVVKCLAGSSPVASALRQRRPIGRSRQRQNLESVGPNPTVVIKYYKTNC